MATPELFKLNRAERESALWKSLVEYFESLIESARDDLEHGNVNVDKCRGALQVLRLIIDLGTDRDGQE